MYQRVVGSDILIIGDLHISDKAVVGRHKNYLKNCFDCLADILEKVHERKPSAVVFLGDLVGTSERNIKSREVLAMFCKFFKDISKYSKVYCVRGNHDSGDYPEFQFLSELGLFETATSSDGYFDYYGYEGQIEPEIRFHLVDYGNERKPLSLAGGSTTDIVLAHNNFTIQGVTNWYQSKDGIELSSLDNFAGVYMVISGHIHNPSPDIVATEMVAGGQCCLFYTGCPTRPAEQYPSCWIVRFGYNADSQCTDYDALELPLSPVSETFYTEDTFIEDMTEEQIAEVERTMALKEVLDEIITCRITSGDLISQVNNIPNASQDAKNMACHYLQLALNNRR